MFVAEINSTCDVDKTEFRESVFTSEAWLSLFEGRLKRYGVFKNDSLQAIFAIHFRKIACFTIVENPGLTPHCGLVFKKKEGKPVSLASWKKEIMKTIAEFIDALPCSLVSLSFPTWIGDLQPFLWLNYKTFVRYTYLINLQKMSDIELMRSMSSNRRNQIRNAFKKGLTCKSITNYSEIIELIKKTFHRQDMRFNVNLIDKTFHKYSKRKNSFGFIVFHNGVPAAAHFCVYDHIRAYNLLAGHDDKIGHNTAAGPMAMFECIKHARNLDLEHFDFEGSNVPGIEQYFRSFGGELTPSFRVVKASLPIEMALKPFKRQLF